MKHYDRSSSGCSCSCLYRKWPHILVTTSFIGLCLIAFFKWMALDWLVHQQIAQKLQLVPGSETFNKWKEIPVPIIIKFRIWNVTNPVAVQNGARPRLAEAGPYVYQEKRIKEIIAMDSERDTITYKQRIIYTFRPDLSNGTEYDRLVVINVPFVTLSKLTYDNVGNFSFAHALADRNMRQRGERLFTFATVKEYMFDGYNVQHYLNFLKSPAVTLVGGVKIPGSIATGRFGFYYGKNATSDGEYVIRTGKTNPQEFGQIVSWNGKTKLDYYNGMCNLINGSDGSLAPPFITKQTRVRFFSSDICRSMFAVFREEVNVKGVTAYRFKMPNAKTVFDHKDFCFCPKGKNNECFKQGVLSMAPCRDGAPIAMSSAHFVGAWEPYQNMIEGINPDPNKHETFIDIEPKTGLILRASKRVQFNVMVHPNRDMPTFSQVRSTLFPFMWVEEMAESSDEFIESLQQQLFRPVEMAHKASIGGLVSCSILIVLGIIGCIFVTPRRRKASSIASENTDSFHGGVVDLSRSSSRSRSGSLNSVRTLSHISSMSSGSSTHPKSVGSIISVVSRGTMTSENKGTMTDGHFDVEEEVRKLKKAAEAEGSPSPSQSVTPTPTSITPKNSYDSSISAKQLSSQYYDNVAYKETEIIHNYLSTKAKDAITSID